MKTVRCDSCNTLIEGKTDVCPLCGAKIENDGALAYAERKKRAGKYNVSFSLYYLLFSSLVTLACSVINLYIHASYQWWITSAISAALIYFLIRHTVLGVRNLASKIVLASIFGISFVYGVCAIFNYETGLVYVVTSFAAAFCLCVYVYVFATFKYSRAHIISLFFAGFSCAIPFFICLTYGIIALYPSLVAGIGVTLSVASSMVFAKETAVELKRFFTF